MDAADTKNVHSPNGAAEDLPKWGKTDYREPWYPIFAKLVKINWLHAGLTMLEQKVQEETGSVDRIPASMQEVMDAVEDRIHALARKRPEEKNERKKEVTAFQEFVHFLTRAMAHHAGLSIPECNLPDGLLGEGECVSKYNPLTHTITIRRAEMDVDGGQDFGTTVGEEIGHFLRDYYSSPRSERMDKFIHWRREPVRMLIRDVKEIQEVIIDAVKCVMRIPPDTHSPYSIAGKSVSEFYGMALRKLLYEATRGTEVGELLFPKGEPQMESPDRSYKILKLEERQSRWPKRSSLRLDRASSAYHARGYQFGGLLDVKRIKNWERFLSMDVAEVRRRFFREDMDYSGLE